MIDNAKVCNVVTVTETAHPVQWCFPLDKDKSLRDYAESSYSQMRRQELKKHYQENGAIYLVNGENIMRPEYNLYLDACYAYVMPRERSIDIDEEIDLIILKAIIENNNSKR